MGDWRRYRGVKWGFREKDSRKEGQRECSNGVEEGEGHAISRKKILGLFLFFLLSE